MNEKTEQENLSIGIMRLRCGLELSKDELTAVDKYLNSELRTQKFIGRGLWIFCGIAYLTMFIFWVLK